MFLRLFPRNEKYRSGSDVPRGSGLAPFGIIRKLLGGRDRKQYRLEFLGVLGPKSCGTDGKPIFHAYRTHKEQWFSPRAQFANHLFADLLAKNWTVTLSPIGKGRELSSKSMTA